LRLRNLWLLAFSILFYAWGEVGFVGLMLASTVINYFLGSWVEKESDERRRRWAVGVAIAFNLGLLGVFKYTNFAVHNLNALLGMIGAKPVMVKDVRLPIGISFFTFHAISYVMDIYRRKWAAAKNPADVALYIFFFPQLIAGPILRWNAIAPQIASRRQSIDRFAQGIRRFAEGLAKKVIIANAVAVPADAIFGASSDWHDLTVATAWVGAICYMLQIYFDFSGYSDMAIGLGTMFGFEFMENFNYPYVAQSIRDFWRRWHISLSSWFRDYLYIPLGGNRCSERRNKVNLVVVFLLCGLWHGASWTFVLWGLSSCWNTASGAGTSNVSPAHCATLTPWWWFWWVGSFSARQVSGWPWGSCATWPAFAWAASRLRLWPASSITRESSRWWSVCYWPRRYGQG